MTPEQRARLDAWMEGRETESYWLESRRECVRAALAHIDALEARVGELEREPQVAEWPCSHEQLKRLQAWVVRVKRYPVGDSGPFPEDVAAVLNDNAALREALKGRKI